MPMQAHVEGDNHLGNSKHLQLVVAAGASNRFTLYEDDGETRDYEQGVCATTEFEWKYSGKNAQLTIHAAQGSAHLLPAQRCYTIIFKGFSQGCGFSVNGEPLKATYSPSDAAYIVTIEDVNTASGITVCVQSETSLLHDNRDYYERIIDLLTRAQCELSVKERWLQLVNTVRDNNVINEVDFVNTTENHLARAVFELLHQVFHQSELVPPPGLPE